MLGFVLPKSEIVLFLITIEQRRKLAAACIRYRRFLLGTWPETSVAF